MIADHAPDPIAIELRPVTAADDALLRRIYASSREFELSLTRWDEAMQTAFLQHQYAAQRDYYIRVYPRAKHEIILVNAEPVGRLWVERNAEEIRILDLVVVTEAQRRGIGTQILNGLQSEARTEVKPLKVYVESGNPSLGLFERVNFKMVEEKGPHLLLIWEPSAES